MERIEDVSDGTGERTEESPRVVLKKKSSALDSSTSDLSGSMEPANYRPVLICLAGPLRSLRCALTQRELVIGRGAAATWRLSDSSASRLHARITYENFDKPGEKPRCFVEDLDSRNGTEVNGVLIRGRTPLEERARILVGSTVLGFFIRDRDELRHDENLYESATRDVLTGLENRRQITAMMRHHMARARRSRTPLCFLLMDLDHFKEVNDRFGHDVGDQTLRHVAELLRKSCRESDLVGRWGGEEFAVCLPDTDPENALRLAERIRRSIELATLDVEGSTLRITASIGGATYYSGDTLEMLFHRADRMLYRAKNRGRNCVEYTDETVELD